MKRNQIKSAIDNTQAKQETKYECAKGVTKKSENRLLLQIRRLSRLTHGVNSRKLTATTAATEPRNKRRKTQVAREAVQRREQERKREVGRTSCRLLLRSRLQSLNPNPNPRRRDLGFYVLLALTLRDKILGSKHSSGLSMLQLQTWTL